VLSINRTFEALMRALFASALLIMF
jgi:hypothetical protein